MAFNIKYLSGLSIYKNHREQFVKLIDFFELLKSTHAPTDKKLKKSNIERNLKKINIEGQVWVSVRSVLTFIFQHDKDFDVCQQIASEIERKISTTDVEPSTLCLYEEIVKANYWTLIGDSGFLQLFDFEEDSIPSVCDIHKKDFNNENWTKICLFEKQFSETHLDISRDSYEKQLAKKWDFHCKLCNAFQTSKQLQNDSRSAINTRLKRKLVAQKSSAIKIKTTTAHLPEILESQILDLFPKSYEIASCLCVDCTRSCSHEPAVHVYLGFSNHKLDNIKDIESSITSYLENKHSCNCAEIVFFDNNTSKFDDETGKRRFKFRDLYLHGKLQSDILYQCLPAQDVSVMEEQTCNECFPSTLPQPLQGNTFEILPEWYINTPLICQILLEPIVNKRSLAKADTKDVFLKQKLTKLYTLYDTLLNTSNRNYSGVLQDISTQELSMNFQSIKSVFSVTGAFGTTKSLRSAENMIKLSATDDKCYYDTYLRKFEMNYTSAAGQKTEMVNLRECVIILMMDNLVRLKYHADPDPGESRSMQMCTLPITLKGLPKDCIEVEHWHHPDCDGDDICSCKKDRSLSKEDVERLVMNLTEAEDDILLKFKQLNTWGYKAAWEFIFENDVHKTQPNDFQWDYRFSQANIDSDQNATMNLEESLASLHIDESLSEEEDISLQVPHSSLSGAVLTTQIEFNDALKEQELDELNELFNFDMEALPGAIDLAEEGDISLEGSFIGVCIDSDDDLSTGIVKKQEHKTETLGVELSSFLQGIGFQQFKPPKLLTRHPPPAVGRDDDIRKLQEILDDILIKTDTNDYSIADKILFGPDNKIGANLLKLQESNTMYNTFLAEFPVLHLRKSKINILCSAYKDAGILHILKYMRDDEVKEWKQLITAEHIEKATRYIRRLSIALHIAFMCKFIQGKSSVEQQESIEHISQLNSIDEHWQQFDDFMKKGVRKNGTFALHYDIMNHCDEVSAIALAERLGGEQGYTLLLAVVKTSLPFSFLNGASSYAGFTTRLLHEHLKAGHFYQQMKSTLFTTPHKDSDINFAMDAQREMDHRDVLKAFRSGSNVSSVIPRMSLIDSLNEIHEVTIRQYAKEETSAKKRSRSLENLLGLTITATDKRYISRLVGLILRQGGLSTMEDSNVYNVYNQKRPSLSDAILDKNTNEIGQFLIRRFIVQTQIFGCSKTDQPDVSSVRGPNGLLQKLKQSKGVTLRRTSVKPQITGKSERQLKEDKRKKTVQKETKLIDCYSSEMNACQAIVKPDCSKPKVMKSVGMKKALNNVLSKVISTAANSDAENNADLEKAGLIFSSKKTVPKEIACSVTKATVEFAGVKFKTNAVTGKQYLKYIESSVIGRSQIMFPNLNYLAICEEKYSFTPDDFKAATRCQRKDKSQFTITHLKTPSEVLCLEKFDKASVTSTSEGKSIVSTYLARNVEKIHIKSNLTLDIDSELHITKCECQTNTCTCARYTTPIRAVFTQQQGLQSIHLLPEIRQCKGEAEMAQLDWLFNYVKTLDEGQSCASIVTSGDIDSVVLHLFALSYLWPRSGDQNKFQHHVYVILQKTGGLLDIFNITGILEVLEREWRDNSIGIKIALALSLGGNDFLPKFHGLTHSKTLDIFMENKELRQNLFKISRDDSKVKIHFDEILYKDLVKRLYCPKNADPSDFIYDEIRQISIRPPTKRNEKTLRNPQTWLPPESAIEQLAKNVDCLIQYYLTIGQADASLPDFLKNGCLTKLCGGDIEYDLGPDKGYISLPSI